MIGLRGGEVLATYQAQRNNDISRFSGQDSPWPGNGGSVETRPKKLNIDTKVLSPIVGPERAQTPDDKTLRVEKIRQIRGKAMDLAQKHYKKPTVGDNTEIRVTTSPKSRWRGPSLTTFKLKRKISAQEHVESVKDAYYTRPSLNLSRPNVVERNAEVQSPRHTSEGSQAPKMRRWRSNTACSKPPETYVSGSYRTQHSTPGHLSGRSMLRRLSNKHKHILQPKRRSRSLDDTFGSIVLSPNTSAAVAPSKTLNTKDVVVSLSDSLSFVQDRKNYVRAPPQRHLPSPMENLASRLKVEERLCQTMPLVHETTKVSSLRCSSLYIDTFPELLELDVSDSAQFWIAIRAQHVVAPEVTQKLKDTPVGIIVLLDNSQMFPVPTRTGLEAEQGTSHAVDLEMAKLREMVFALTRRLKQPGDELAVFVTACCHTDTESLATIGCQLHPLGKPSKRILEKELATLMNAVHSNPAQINGNQQASADRLARTIESVTSLLKDHKREKPNQLNHHLIVMSSNFFDPTTYSASEMPIHTVDPTWLGNSINASMINTNHSVTEWAHQFIGNARACADMHTLRGITIDVRPGRGTDILQIVGEREHESLGIGQEICAFVEVQVNQIAPNTTSRHVPRQEIPVLLSMEEALDDLCYILGETTHPVLEVSMTFQDQDHDSDLYFSVNQAFCNIKRPNAASLWNFKPSPNSTAIASDTKSALMGRTDICRLLASNSASFACTKGALNIVESFIAESEASSDILNRFGVIRSRLADQLGFDTPKHNASHRGNGTGSPQLGRFSFEPGDHKPSAIESASAMRLPLSPILQTRSKDMACNIRRLMRRDSKTQKQLGSAPTSEEMHELEQGNGKSERCGEKL